MRYYIVHERERKDRYELFYETQGKGAAHAARRRRNIYRIRRAAGRGGYSAGQGNTDMSGVCWHWLKEALYNF